MTEHEKAEKFCEEFLSDQNIRYLGLSSVQVDNISIMLRARLRILFRSGIIRCKECGSSMNVREDDWVCGTCEE